MDWVSLSNRMECWNLKYKKVECERAVSAERNGVLHNQRKYNEISVN